MKTFTNFKCVLIIAILLVIVAKDTECRGGRGRGGGSLGGLFGGWRKYKKPSSNGNSRRTTNVSAMHTTNSKTLNAGSTSSTKYSKLGKTQSSYPKQSVPSNSGAFVPNSQRYGPIPQGSTYYANSATIPQGALFYSQPPSRSGAGDMVVGMMAGHMMSRAMFGPRTHVTHVYHQNEPGNGNSGNGGKVIIINNGNVESSTTTKPVEAEIPWFAGIESFFSSESASETEEQVTQQSEQQELPAPHGIFCMNMLFNQTDTNDGTSMEPIEKLVCFPAPPPEPVTESPISSKRNCKVHKVPQPDPNDPNKTVYVKIEDCIPEKPIQVAGEIGDKTMSAEETKTEKVEIVNDQMEA